MIKSCRKVYKLSFFANSMLDLKFVREHPDVVKKDLEKRDDKEKLVWVDDILSLDKEYRALLQQSQDLRKRRNDLSKAVSEAKKAGEDSAAFMD